jgi:hypothetical protein
MSRRVLAVSLAAVVLVGCAPTFYKSAMTSQSLAADQFDCKVAGNTYAASPGLAPIGMLSGGAGLVAVSRRAWAPAL